jgi:hypothetical protein
MRDTKRLGRLIAVRERMLSVRRGELADAAAALVRAEDDATRVGSELVETVHALAMSADLLPEDLALRATTVRATAAELKRAEVACVERAKQRDEHVARAFEAKRDVRVLEELELRISSVERRDGARREQASTDETAASRSTRRT